MKDQLISFETAKLAKEKGFYIINSDILNWYHNNGEKAGDFDFRLMNTKITDYQTHEGILAPTQSLLQKWLREKHNLFITIEQDFEPIPFTEPINKRGDRLMQHSGKYFLIVRTPNEGLSTPNSHIGKTYEEALEVGLIRALNLIKL